MNPEQSFLGQGWSFPPTFSQGGQQLHLVAGPKDIEQSLQILLGTRLKERIMQEDYGAQMEGFLFQPTNTGLVNRLRNMITNAIIFNEARIKLNEVDIKTDQLNEGLLLINLDYSIPASNSRYNLVYPFYLKEN